MLLQSGHLHLYRHPWALDRLLVDLRALGYETVRADLARCADDQAVREAVIDAVPGWSPGDWHPSWHGFANGLREHLLHEGRELTVLVLQGFDQARRNDKTQVAILLDQLAHAARWHLLFGRRIICLIGTADSDLDLPPVGAEFVSWNRHEWLLAHRTGTRRPPWIRFEDRAD